VIDLGGRGCIVLGAGAGIGAATARTFAEVGARVLCVDRDAELAATIAAEVRGVPWSADVTKAADVTGIFTDGARALERPLHGVADIVGIATTRPLAEIDEEAWDGQFDIVLRHAYHTLRSGSAALAERGGSIVFVGSLAGSVSIANQAVYGAAKAALHHLVRTMACELGPKNVRVNAVAPGIVQTPRLLAKHGPEMWQRFEQVTPLRRTATPEDIAAAIVFLLSDAARMITGVILPVDGGLSAASVVPDLRT
jgi:NAD(P)-dependent dehydrogenase (short-subunit alcohol dehydrogenase family)